MPRALAVAGVAWLAFGLTVITIAVIDLGRAGDDTSGATADQFDGSAINPGPAGPGGYSPTTDFLALALAAAVLALIVALITAQGWARLAIESVGAVIVIVLAAGGRWAAFAAMPLLIVATVPTMSRSVHAYLIGKADVRPAGQAVEDR